MAARKTTTSGRSGKTPRGKAGSSPARKSATRRAGKNAAASKPRKPSKKTSRRSAKKPSDQKLYTLTEVGKMASVSMPTLQKYKKRYADRIPSVGEGRRQRYPKEAIAVFKQLKKENLAKRGRPPKKAGARKQRSAARGGGKGSSDLLTLTEIGKRTGISYPTLQRYVKLFLDRIPHEGTGRKRRFPEGAVPVFRQLRSESRPGRPKSSGSTPQGRGASRGSDAALNARLKKLEKAQADLGKQLSQVVKLLKKPVQVTIKRS